MDSSTIPGPVPLTTCRKCCEVIEDEKFVAAQDFVWHCRCFVCTVCNQELTCTYYEHDGSPYCTKDFFTQFGALCNRCTLCITGPMMCAGQQRFHPECFVCERCTGPIGEGDPFALVDRKKLFCDTCFQQKRPNSKTRIITTVILPPGAVNLLQITGGDCPKKKKRGLILSNIFRGKGSAGDVNRTIISSCDGNGVQEGDRIIEVNSTPVTDTTPDEVWKLIREKSSSGADVMLTVERRRRGSKIRTPGSGRRNLSMWERTSDQRSPQGQYQSQSSPQLGTPPGSRLDLHRKRSDPVIRHTRISSTTGDSPQVLTCTPVKTPLSPGFYLAQKPQTASVEVSPEQSREGRQAVRKCLSLGRGGNMPTSQGSLSQSCDSTPTRFSSSDAGMNDRCAALATPSPGGCTSEDDDYEEDDDDDDDAVQSQSPELKGRMSQASVQLVTRISKMERMRTSTLPGRVYSAERASVNVANSVLCRGETFTERHRSSRSVFRTNDLEFGEVLGQGFFGRAVRVVNKANGEVMVMKELIKCTAEARQNFLQEVQMMKALEHANVMPLLGIMYRGRNLCIITEYIGGGTLSERIMNKDIPLPDDLKVHFACDIAAGMAYLHANKIIHRDLTSNNCMIRTNNSVVVGDFGLAKVLAGKDPNQLKIVGSAYWMAPEMMLGKRYDFHADIFSFGIITCELIGRISADPDEMPRTKVFGLDDEAFRAQYLGQFSPQIFAVPVLCCQLDPDSRPMFSTIEAFLNALITALDNCVVFSQKFPAFVKAYEAT